MKNILLCLIAASALISCTKPQDKFVGKWEMHTKKCDVWFDIAKNGDEYILTKGKMDADIVGQKMHISPTYEDIPMFVNAGLKIVNDTSMTTPPYGNINNFTLTYLAESDLLAINPVLYCGSISLKRVSQ